MTIKPRDRPDANYPTDIQHARLLKALHVTQIGQKQTGKEKERDGKGCRGERW